MNNIFLKDYSISLTDFVLFPIKTPYAKRHWQQKSLLHKCIGCVEYIPLFGPALSLVERVAALAFHAFAKLCKSLKSKSALHQINILLERKKIHENYADFLEFNHAFREWKKLHPNQKTEPIIQDISSLTRATKDLLDKIQALTQRAEDNEPKKSWEKEHQQLEDTYRERIQPPLCSIGVFEVPQSLQEKIRMYCMEPFPTIQGSLKLGETIQTYWKFKLAIGNEEIFSKIKNLSELLFKPIELSIHQERKRATDERYRQNVLKIKQEAAQEAARIQQEAEQSDKKYARKRAALQAQAKKAQAQRQKARQRQELESKRKAKQRKLEFQQEQMKIARSFQADAYRIVRELEQDLLGNEQ